MLPRPISRDRRRLRTSGVSRRGTQACAGAQCSLGAWLYTILSEAYELILSRGPQAQKPLYYSVATTLHFDSEHSSPDVASSILPKEVTVRCASLQDSLIEHFTPILFTVATASHMACTDIFAETWMPLVIAPAIETSGLCTPVETLRKIQGIKWEEHGMCQECCAEKRREWEDEARNIWEKVDGWLGLSGSGGDGGELKN